MTVGLISMGGWVSGVVANRKGKERRSDSSSGESAAKFISFATPLHPVIST